MMRAKTNGNVLWEYGIIGMLIVAVCVTAVMILGRDIDTIVKRLKYDMNYNVSASNRVQTGGGAANE